MFLLRTWLTLVLVVFGLSACSINSSVKYSDQKRPGPVVVLGDSLASGFGVEQGQGFVEILTPELGVEVVNLAIKGKTTAESVPRVSAEVLPLKPSLVVIELGGNDALQKVDPSTTKANLAEMIEKVHADKIPVLLLGVRGGLFSDKLADVYEELSEQYEVALVPDIMDGVFTKASLKADAIHPNAEGHKVVAETVRPELTRLVELVCLKK